MIKAGLIGIFVSLIYVTSLTLLSPFCALCFAPFLGIGVGYLAAWFDKPQTTKASTISGTIAAAITGVGAFIGQMLAAIISTILITNLEQLPALMEQFGLGEFAITDTNEYWQATLSMTSLCGLLTWGIIIALGAAGGMLWYQKQNQGTLFTSF